MSLQENFSNERAWRKGPGIPAGHDVEVALFGAAPVPRKEQHDGYLSFGQAIEFAKKHQSSPLERSRVVRDLRAQIAALCDDTTIPVRFFTAVGTPLDVYHGVDGFFEQGGRIATVDVSLREKDAHKADVLIVATLDEEGKVEVSDKELMQAAEHIATQLNTTPERRVA